MSSVVAFLATFSVTFLTTPTVTLGDENRRWSNSYQQLQSSYLVNQKGSYPAAAASGGSNNNPASSSLFTPAPAHDGGVRVSCS